MTTFEEGAAAARAGLAEHDCPYVYSKIAPPGGIVEYIASGAEQKRSQWMAGWRSVRASPAAPSNP